MQPAMKLNYFNHDFSTSSEWSDRHDLHIELVKNQSARRCSKGRQPMKPTAWASVPVLRPTGRRVRCMYHNEIHKFGSGKARNLKFSTRVDFGKSHPWMTKKSPKGAWWGPWAELLNFGACHKFGNSEARNLKFGTHIDLGMSHLKDDKIPIKGVWWGSWAEFFLNCGTPAINLECIYRVAQKTGPPYLIANILKIPWPNCVEIGELLQYYILVLPGLGL